MAITWQDRLMDLALYTLRSMTGAQIALVLCLGLLCFTVMGILLLLADGVRIKTLLSGLVPPVLRRKRLDK